MPQLSLTSSLPTRYHEGGWALAIPRGWVLALCVLMSRLVSLDEEHMLDEDGLHEQPVAIKFVAVDKGSTFFFFLGKDLLLEESKTIRRGVPHLFSPSTKPVDPVV